MSEELQGISGIEATSGKPLPTPDRVDEWPDWIWDPPLDPRIKRFYQKWNERLDKFDPKREPVYKIDGQRVNVHDLSSAGYAVVFAAGITEEIKAQLSPLLEHRRRQAGQLFRLIHFRSGRSKIDFLHDLGAEPGDANPLQLPYYVLLVGSPEEIPFDFQYELDVERAVGRIYFETPEAYGRYARSVVAAETGEAPPPPREIACFGAVTDDTSARTAENLLLPLAEALKKSGGTNWEVRTWSDQEAKKPLLGQILGGEHRSALAIASGHGVVFPSGDPRQKPAQGALLCKDETDSSGAGSELPPEFYFAGDDLEEQARLSGSIVALFACYSAGTPELSSFSDRRLGVPPRIAPQPFVATLAQRLLSHGALAVLGHIDRMWTLSFSWSRESQVDAFASLLQRLLDGFRIGAATESLNRRYTTYAVEYSRLAELKARLVQVDPQHFVRVWHAQNDSRNFIVLGDPAVRIAEPSQPTPT